MMKNGSVGCVAVLIVAAIIAVAIAVSGAAWYYSINQWLAFAGSTSSIAYWHGCVIACIPPIGPLGCAGAVITWIAMKVL